jgi:hypothetical protein
MVTEQIAAIPKLVASVTDTSGGPHTNLTARAHIGGEFGSAFTVNLGAVSRNLWHTHGTDG